ncbi:MAG: tail fiber domain-containing protein [Bacteroidales bacterium]|nr:tail fiber domain-containing protein [Bacteroidales bacterium]
MKNIYKISITLLLALMSSFLIAQAPQSFKYQTVVRDASGNPMANQNVNLRFSIHDANAAGMVVYSENHAVLTNPFGLVSLNIGEGVPVSGDFSAIDWGTHDKFLEVELDMGSGYTTMGTSQLQSVPYALFSENTANVDDADADPANELQILTRMGNEVNLSQGGGSFIDETEDDDADPANELQTLSIAGNELSISDGNSVILPGSGMNNRISDNDGDTWIDVERNTDNDSIVFTTFGMERMVISHNGYVEVNGQMIATGFQGDGSGLTGVPGDDLGDHTATEDLDMNNFLITNVVSPIDANDAATKLYVDTQISLSGDNLGDHNAIQNIAMNGHRISNDGDNEGISVNNDGNVGINNGFPDQKLTVNGNIRAEEQVLAGYGTTSDPSFRFGAGSENSGIASPYVNSVAVITTGTERLTVRQNGNVGIGETNPQAPLHIIGHIRINDGNQGPGKVLTSDGLGNAMWENPVAMDDGDWVVAGDDLYSGVSGNTGIGTTNPGAKLDVSGNIWQTGTGHSVFIGEEAGAHDDLSDNRNVFVGYYSGNTNTYGDHNTAYGYYSMYANTTGIRNTACGALALYSNTSGNYNIASGYEALFYNTTGSDNIAYGQLSLMNNISGYSNVAVGSKTLHHSTNKSNLVAIGDSAMYYNGFGASQPCHSVNNTAIGSKALYLNTIGSNNSSVGYNSLYSNTSGNYNTASGFASLYSNTTGSFNSATGTQSMVNNSTGNKNTSAGGYALFHNTTGDNNTSMGYAALYSNESGYSNVGVGAGALYHAIDEKNLVAVGDSAMYLNGLGATTSAMARENTALGSKALMTNTKGSTNTATGYRSLYNNSDGDCNTANAAYSLYNNAAGDCNTAFGCNSLFSNTSGSYNTAIGHNALFTGINHNNSTAIGFDAQVGSSNMIVLGNSSVTWIGGYSSWHNVSDERVKNNVHEDVGGLGFILALRPVTYFLDKDKIDDLIGVEDQSEYPEKYDVENIKHSGFIAQEVEEAALKSGYDFSGVRAPEGDLKYYSISYAEFVVPLVKAVQEQQGIIIKLEKENNEIRARLELLEKHQ